MKKTGSFSNIVFAGLIASFILVPTADAHISIADDYECSDSHEKNCWTMPLSNKKLRLFFDGTTQEYGRNCEYQTLRFGHEIVRAEKALGVERGAISYSQPFVEFHGSTGQPTQLRCTYEVWSNRKDLRFDIRNMGTTKISINKPEPELVKACEDNVAKARAINGSIGGGRWQYQKTIFSNECSSKYAMPGLDRLGKDSNGNPVIIKFGSREFDQPDSTRADSSTRSGSGEQY